MKRPLLALAIFFSFGIILASLISLPFGWIYFCALILFILSALFLKKELLFKLLICGLAFVTGIILLCNAQVIPKSDIVNFVPLNNNSLSCVIQGVINSEPDFKDNKTFFVLKAEKAWVKNRKANCSGNLLVYIKGRPRLVYGEELILKGELRRIVASNKKQGYSNYLSNQNIYSVFAVKEKHHVIMIKKNQAPKIMLLASGLKAKIKRIISLNIIPAQASILKAMILGEKSAIPQQIYNSMVKTGTVHILVVSGFNVGIVAFILNLFLKLIRLPRRLRFVIATLCLILYCLVTGASNPVLRATIMAVVFMWGFLIEREPDQHNALALAMLFILVINPKQLFDIGFQLSFASVFSIIFLYPKLKALLRLESLKLRFLRNLASGCLVSFSCWIGTMGLVACYFRLFTPITVLANLFIVPLATLITLCGFSLIFAYFFLPAFSPYFSQSAEMAVMLLFCVNSFLVKLPWAYFNLASN
ncbi:MAG: ComEC/Rec2 family competence protein [Candidatus Omnitrophota bacterium]